MTHLCFKSIQLNIPYKLAFPIILRALQEIGAQRLETENNSQRAIIFAQKVPGSQPGGEEILILVEKLAAAQTSVHIASKSTSPGSRTGSDKNQENIGRFEVSLGRLAYEKQQNIEKEIISPGKNRRTDSKTANLPIKSIQSPFQILEVAPGANQGEITSAYRRKVKKYHPDRLTGFPLEFRLIAEERMKEFNAAYKEIIHKPS